MTMIVEHYGLVPRLKLHSIQPVLGHQEIVDDIDRLAADLPLFITGNYFAGLAIEDCVSRSFDEFGRLQRLQQTRSER